MLFKVFVHLDLYGKSLNIDFLPAFANYFSGMHFFYFSGYKDEIVLQTPK